MCRQVCGMLKKSVHFNLYSPLIKLTDDRKVEEEYLFQSGRGHQHGDRQAH